VKIPGSGDLNALPTNFKINRFLDVLAIKECNTSGVKCGNCEKKKATRVATASSVVRSGAITVSASIMASKQTKNTTHWR